MPNVPYPYEVNWQLVSGNGSLTPICFLSNRSSSPSLTVQTSCADFNTQSCKYFTFLGWKVKVKSDNSDKFVWHSFIGGNDAQKYCPHQCGQKDTHLAQNIGLGLL